MTDPLRMLQGEGDELEVALLHAGASEAPSRATRRHALLAVGVGSAATAAATNAGAAAGAATAVAATTKAAAITAAGLPATWTVTAGVVVKWVGIAAVGAAATWGLNESLNPPPGALVVATVSETSRRLAERAAVDVTGLEHRASGGVARGAPPIATAPLAPAADSPLPLGAAATAPAPPPQVVHERSAAGLADEVAALDRARDAMGRDDPSQALAALSDYRRHFGTGALAPEAEVIRIEALARSGRRDEARLAAEHFLKTHPSSPHAQRVRSVLQQTTAAP